MVQCGLWVQILMLALPSCMTWGKLQTIYGPFCCSCHPPRPPSERQQGAYCRGPWRGFLRWCTKQFTQPVAKQVLGTASWHHHPHSLTPTYLAYLYSWPGSEALKSARPSESQPLAGRVDPNKSCGLQCPVQWAEKQYLIHRTGSVRPR